MKISKKLIICSIAAIIIGISSVVPLVFLMTAVAMLLFFTEGVLLRRKNNT